MPLTSRQQQFYDLLQQFIEAHGQAPTLEELKEYLEKNKWGEIKSLNSLTQYLDALERAGKIRRERKKRGVMLTESTETVSLPLLPNPVACGAPTALIEETAEDHLTVSRRLVRNPGQTYIFRASGDSMNRAGIDDGDFVLVESTLDLRDGDIVLATIDGCGTLKKIRKGMNTITLLPDSTNPIHKPIYLHTDDDFLIAGKVVNVLKN